MWMSRRMPRSGLLLPLPMLLGPSCDTHLWISPDLLSIMSTVLYMYLLYYEDLRLYDRQWLRRIEIHELDILRRPSN